MNKKNKIHNLDSLEKEISRLRLAAKEKEKELSKNASYFRDNATSLFMNSFFSKKKKESTEAKNNHESFFSNERVSSFLGRVADRIANRAADSIDSLLEKIFHKRKQHTPQ